MKARTGRRHRKSEAGPQLGTMWGIFGHAKSASE